jgi:hypothetical protein
VIVALTMSDVMEGDYSYHQYDVDNHHRILRRREEEEDDDDSHYDDDLQNLGMSVSNSVLEYSDASEDYVTHYTAGSDEGSTKNRSTTYR